MPTAMPHEVLNTDDSCQQLNPADLAESDTLHPASGYASTLTVCRNGKPIGWVWVEDFGHMTVIDWIDAHLTR
jgi:hypothetical protein